MIRFGKWFGGDIKRSAAKFSEIYGLRHPKRRWEDRSPKGSEVCAHKREKGKICVEVATSVHTLPIPCIQLEAPFSRCPKPLLYPSFSTWSFGEELQTSTCSPPETRSCSHATFHILCMAQSIFVNFKYSVAFHSQVTSVTLHILQMSKMSLHNFESLRKDPIL